MLFIDEMHTLVGAGKADGAMDASNLLKPALARGELHCVGATTLDEYRKHVEKDAALARRFQPVFVSEPTVEDTISILRGLKEKYELHHGVRITDSGHRRGRDAVEPLHHRPLPARQGDRPRRRGLGAAAHAGRFQARGARRIRPPHHPAQDRAGSAEEGERRCLEGAAAPPRGRACGAPGEGGRADGALARREGQARRRAEAQGAARRGPQRADDRAAPRRVSARRRADLRRHPGPREEARRARGQGRRPACRRGRDGRPRGAGRVALDRRAGRQDARGREGQAAPHGGGARQARRRPGGGGGGGVDRGAARPRRAAGSRTGRSARSCSSGRPASARRS